MCSESGGSASSGGARSDDSEGEEAALEEELSLVDEAAPARVLAALNALRKARQHYDVLLAAGAGGGGGAGEEVAAHRAVLAAVSPRLLAALPAAPPPPGAPALRLPDVDADALRELVEYAYTGRLRVRDAAGARRLYRAAARLRVETARAHLAERLVRRPAPQDALAVRALPDLQRHHRAALDAYIAEHVSAAPSSLSPARHPGLPHHGSEPLCISSLTRYARAARWRRCHSSTSRCCARRVRSAGRRRPRPSPAPRSPGCATSSPPASTSVHFSVMQ